MINNLVIQRDGKILVTGEYSKIENIVTNGVLRIEEGGDKDRQFVPPVMGTNDEVSAIALDRDGSIIIGGTYMTETSSTKHYLVGLDPDGTYGDWFTPEYPDGKILALLMQEDGKVIVAGDYTHFKEGSRHALARVHNDGSLDQTFNSNLAAGTSVHALALQNDGKLLLGGDFKQGEGDDAQTNLARVNADGSLDRNFAKVVDDWVFSVLQQHDGQVLIGGVFKNIDGHERKYLARLNPDGSLDTSFTPDTGLLGWVYSMVQQDDGKIVIGGEFSSINDTDRNHIARLNLDGSLDTSFNPGTGADESVKVMRLQSDGKILIGGEFTSYDGTPRRHIARLNDDGSLDLGFGDD
ncbi:MAG: delta-60 repeat domain-containing protein [Pseudomonadota bacterium]